MGTGTGQHQNWAGVGGDTVSGAASGAAVGGVPGAFVGAGAGFLTGLLTADSPDAPPPPEAPPTPPDLAEELAQRGEIANQMRLMGDGAGNFLTGPLGDTTKPVGYAPAAKAA